MDNKFKTQKDYALKTLGEARAKGEVDTDMLSLIDYINSLQDYYTTSSCAGRTSVFFDPGSKKDSDWVGKWHRKVMPEEVSEALKRAPGNGIIWFMHEPTIIHITCRTIENASSLVDLARNSGYKKVGILSFKDDRIIVEVCGTERIDAPMAIEGRKIISDKYLNELTQLANDKFGKGMLRLNRLMKALNELEKR
jgi:tRNA wybutosine-synthesizing protein 3